MSLINSCCTPIIKNCMFLRTFPFLGGGGGRGVPLPPLKIFYLPRAILTNPGPPWCSHLKSLPEKKELTWSVLMDLFKRCSLSYQHILPIIQNNAWLSVVKRIHAQHVLLSQKIEANIVFILCYMILSLLWRHFLTDLKEYHMNSIIRAFVSLTRCGKTYHTAISSPV